MRDRFWQYVNKTEGCWLWTGAKREFGYGVINLGGKHGKIERAHRLSYEMHVGPIPERAFVCHHCDVPACVRPDHLFLGSVGDNNRDMVAKERHDRVKRPKGMKHGMHVLTDEQVRAIRSAYIPGVTTLKDVGQRFGVSLQSVWRIIKGHNWKHLQ